MTPQLGTLTTAVNADSSPPPSLLHPRLSSRLSLFEGIPQEHGLCYHSLSAVAMLLSEAMQEALMLTEAQLDGQ